MPDDKSEFLRKLLVTFRTEAGEHLEAMSSALLALEAATANRRAEIVEQIFREAHSLKGAARAVNFSDVEQICHALESLFSALKSGRIGWDPSLVDLVLRPLDILGALISGEGIQSDPAVPPLVRSLERAAKGASDMGKGARAGAAKRASNQEPPPPSLPPEKEKQFPQQEPAPSLPSGTVRVRISKLNSILRRTEELLGPRLAAEQRVAEIRQTRSVISAWRAKTDSALSARTPLQSSLEQSNGGNGAQRPQPDLSRLLEYAEAGRDFLRTLEEQVARLEKAAVSDHRALAGMVSALLEDVKETQMLPFESLLDGSRRLVRDLAHEQGKSVELVLHGGEIEIDRRILEEMKSPFGHLLRNALDHGIERPEVRQQKGKPPSGTLSIHVSHGERRIEIALRDDGAGIDTGKIRAAARKAGSFSPEEIDAMSDGEALQLVFQSGLSTSPIITELSGRGLGLAIVREKVDRLGGTIELETQQGEGSTIRIVLPLTLATFRGLLVAVADRRFVIPAASVERVTRVSQGDIRTVENRETLSLGGRAVSLVRLADVLELRESRREPREREQVVILGRGAVHIAFLVDSVLAEQEVLVKRLGPQLPRVRNVAGATVLGSGEVVPVLAVPDLLASAAGAAASAAVRGGEPAGEAARRSILVVEDSITSRTLLQQILQTAGFDVEVAVDGQDAWTTLRTRDFDLIVSDVEMPRMDGFELTSKIRSDRTLSALPIVLVTALESREHRERGIDVGASAYIVKSSFDQSNLLEVIRRLI